MEEFHDMHCKGGILSSEKSKRKMKTPAQVEALEKFYNEHKYPTESMKLQFAKQIGLSEKQVSGWFCHRRLRDKKLLQGEIYANGKQSFSNGLIHDRNSGLRQESCNSTKQGDKNFDAKEVESKRFDGHYSPVADLPFRQRVQPAYVEHYNAAGDRSSGSSTASPERLLQKDVNLCAMQPARYSILDENRMLIDTEGVNRRRHMTDARFTYSQGEIKSSAVTWVKLKLGREYREDGPPLSVNFDPLPPGAFDSPVRNSNYEPYYVGDSFRPSSCNVPRIYKEPKMHNKHRCERITSVSYPEGSIHNRRLQGFHHRNEYTDCQLTPKTSVTNNNDHAQNQTFKMGNGEGSAEEASYDYRSNNRNSFKYGVEGTSDDSLSHHFRLNGLKANPTKALPYSCPEYDRSASVCQRELFGSKFIEPTQKCNGFYNLEGIMQTKRPLKALKKKSNKGKTTYENGNSVRPDILLTSDMKMARKRHRVELQQQDYVMKTPEKASLAKQLSRYSEDRAASSTEDETGGSTSSVE